MASQEDEQNPGWAARVLPPAVGGAVGAAGGGLLAFDPKAAKKHEALVEKLKALAKGGGTETEALEEAQKILGKSERLEQPVKDLFAHYAGHAQHKAHAEKARELSATAQEAAKTAKRALGKK